MLMNTELYSRKLEQALLKESKGRVKEDVAKEVAEIHSNSIGLHRRGIVVVNDKDVIQVARHILFTLDKEHFINKQ